MASLLACAKISSASCIYAHKSNQLKLFAYVVTGALEQTMSLGGIFMDKLAYFKLQAKNFFRDFKTQTIDEEGLTKYSPRFFGNIDEILLAYDIDERNFCLMKAQQLIANLAGFKNWSELLHASDEALELGKFLLDKRNAHLPACMGDPLEESWRMYLWSNELQNLLDREKLEIFKAVYLEEPQNGDLNESDEELEYEDCDYDKELANYFRELDALTEELEQL